MVYRAFSGTGGLEESKINKLSVVDIVFAGGCFAGLLSGC